MPSAFITSTLRSITHFSSFILGIPYISRPPTRSLRSNTVTEWPLLFSWSAAASPAGPEPTTATFLPVRMEGGFGRAYPQSYAFSIMARSFSFTVTGSPFRPQVHAASQGAGHTLDVNSGKLLVFLSRLKASCQLPVYTRSFHSGIRLLSGHPLTIPFIITPDWQKGTPHSMHRAPCFLCSASLKGVWNSFQFSILSLAAVSALTSRPYSKNPVIFPMTSHLLIL